MLHPIVLLFALPVSLTAFGQDDPGDWNAVSQKIIDHINNLNTTWKAGRNFHSKVGMDHIRHLVGVLPDSMDDRLDEYLHDNTTADKLPETFDSRKNWPNCPSIGLIRDQSNCGSCWAFAAVEAMSDRICIHSKGDLQVNLSAEDLLACCDMCSFGCFGGNSSAAWNYWKDSGIVSGGLYGTSDGCKPYSLPPCEHHISGAFPNCSGTAREPRCTNSCRVGYAKGYGDDRHYGDRVYSLPADERQIRMEIFNNGPVEAAFIAYEDVLAFRSGVYQHHTGKAVGGHAVKIIGWGIENGTPYWTIANSWNTHWGEQGYFRMLRGKNECGIESTAVAGIPKLNAA